MQKFIFIDVDGTLLSATREMPNSALKAIHSAQKNGHKVFVCTGRAKSEVGDYLLKVGFDGYIFSSGAVIEVSNETIYLNQLEGAILDNILADLNQMGRGYIFEGYDHSYLDEETYRYLMKIHENFYTYDKSASYLIQGKILLINEYTDEERINKLTFYSYHEDEIDKMKALYSTLFDFIVHEKGKRSITSVEMTLPGVSKSSGIDRVLKHFGGSIEQTIAIGDSRNDMDMIEHVEIGICMGDGINALKEIADYVTDTIQNDGIYQAFERFGLL